MDLVKFLILSINFYSQLVYNDPNSNDPDSKYTYIFELPPNV